LGVGYLVSQGAAMKRFLRLSCRALRWMGIHDFAEIIPGLGYCNREGCEEWKELP
jgi:hypothetical protein